MGWLVLVVCSKILHGVLGVFFGGFLRFLVQVPFLTDFLV